MKKLTSSQYRIIFFTLLVLLMIVSSLPAQGHNRKFIAGPLTFRLDYIIHFTLYTFITFVGSLGYSEKIFRKIRSFFGFITGMLLFALIEEGHQYWIPGRVFNWWDYVSDAGGVIVGTGVGFLIAGRDS